MWPLRCGVSAPWGQADQCAGAGRGSSLRPEFGDPPPPEGGGSNLTFSCFEASFGVRRLIGVTEIEKGSSYGNQEFKKKE